MEPSTSTGRKGSLENPEVHEDVPGHVIPILEREFDDFDNEAEKFLAGQTQETEFIGFRLKQGVYGQRQPDVQMVRVKLPCGGITPEQMEMFADVVERWAPLDKAHITTRQNIQIHHIPLRDMAELIREISDVGLSSREGCGNTVRNVTADPWAGVCHDELWDPTPYVGAYVRYFVRHPTTQLMPRKVKTAFTGSDTDRALTGIHDIAFIARERDGVRGFEIRVGGGTSIMPRDRADAGRLRHRRRRRVPQVGRGGLPHLRPPGLAARQPRPRPHQGAGRQDRHRGDARGWSTRSCRATGSPSATSRSTTGCSSTTRRPTRRRRRSSTARRTATARRSRASLAANVEPPAPGGLLRRPGQGGPRRPHARSSSAGSPRSCASSRGGYARTTVHQNLLLRWVRDEAVYDVWRRLRALGLGDAGADQINDVVSCPGTDSCKLGITSSMGLNRAVQERIEAMDITDPLTRRIHIKMSGCPNGCSQHHIGNIGFYGASIKVGEHTIPAYVAHIGGNYEGGEIVYGARLKVRLPAKRVPEAVERWLRKYEAEREDGEAFNAYAERVGTTAFEDEVRDLAMPVEFGLETMNHFIDWNRKVPFQVIRGEGECAV